jgi:uncharacterized protein (TIGR00725 family)
MSNVRRPIIVGVMGPGSSASQQEIDFAYQLGQLIAEQGWYILTGGVNTGVMHAALKGAKDQNPQCVTIAILPHKGEPEKTSEYADIRIPTGMGEGRNNLNVLTADFIVSCCNDLGTSPGTMSEVIFAIKHKKPFVGLHVNDADYRKKYINFFDTFSEEYRHDQQRFAFKPKYVMEFLLKWASEKE